MDLLQQYDLIKAGATAQPSNLIDVGNTRGFQNPGALKWRAQAAQEVEKLKEGCAKRILLDIYCKILPLDSEFVAGHQGLMKQDIDSFVASKGMNAQQYLTSCGDETNAPLVEFVIRSINNIGKAFMEKADETLKDAQDNDIDIPPPVADPESSEVEDQLVEVEKDEEYETFIEKLKKKTVKRIVDEISDLIKGKKEEQNMTFDPKTESTVQVVLDYFHTKLWQEGVDLTPEQNEEVIGIAIREATLNMIDLVFRQPDSDIRPFSTKVRLGKGVIMNESAVDNIKGK